MTHSARRRRAFLLAAIALGAGGACNGGTVDRTLDTTDASSTDDVTKRDVSTGTTGDSPEVVDVRQPDGPGFFVDRAEPMVGPDGSISWPRADSAVETPDAGTWDAGANCPIVAPNVGEPCFIDTPCAYPIDCCGIISGYIQAFCQLGAWTIHTRPNGEFCAPCEPFPVAGEACSLEAACRSGPPPICVKLSCYAQAVVARCLGDKWTVTNGCIK